MNRFSQDASPKQHLEERQRETHCRQKCEGEQALTSHPGVRAWKAGLPGLRHFQAAQGLWPPLPSVMAGPPAPGDGGDGRCSAAPGLSLSPCAGLAPDPRAQRHSSPGATPGRGLRLSVPADGSPARSHQTRAPQGAHPRTRRRGDPGAAEARLGPGAELSPAGVGRPLPGGGAPAGRRRPRSSAG